MRIAGQPEVTHFCDKCTRWYFDSDGKGAYNSDYLLVTHTDMKQQSITNAPLL
jgi:hypothetical protein